MWRKHRIIAEPPGARARLILVWLALAISFVAGPAAAARAFDPSAWLDSVHRMLTEGPVAPAEQLSATARLIEPLTARPPALVLAAGVTAEGHWTFVSQNGQRYTAASAQEIARVYASLAPDITGRPAPVIIYLTSASVFTHGEHLALLPGDARLRLVVGARSYLLRPFGDRPRRWLAEVRANVFAAIDDAPTFVETAWQLARPISRRTVRVLKLQADAPDSFLPIATTGPGGRQFADPINPLKLLDALPTLRRQTAILTGRLRDAGSLVYRTPSGLERELPRARLRQVAAASDINLLFLNAPAPRQPGARNWLWQRVEVDGLVEALGGESFGDFLNALAGGSGPLFVALERHGVNRVTLSVTPMRAGRREPTPGTLTSAFAEIVSEVAGSVVPHAVEADLVSMRRQQELDLRLLPGVPSAIQWGFALAFALGILGLPVAWRWWQRIWPPEIRDSYAGRGGFQAARLMRWAAFVIVFLPLAGLPAILWGFLRPFAGRRRVTKPKADVGAATG